MATAAEPLGFGRAGEQRAVGAVFEATERTDKGQDHRCELHLDRTTFEAGQSQDHGAARGEFLLSQKEPFFPPQELRRCRRSKAQFSSRVSR